MPNDASCTNFMRVLLFSPFYRWRKKLREITKLPRSHTRLLKTKKKTKKKQIPNYLRMILGTDPKAILDPLLNFNTSLVEMKK